MFSLRDTLVDFLEDVPGFEIAHVIWVVFKVLFIIADFLLLGGFIFSFIKGWGYRPQLEPQEAAGRRTKTLLRTVYKERWEGILKKSSGSADSLRLTVIEADSLIDDILKNMGLPGETMADRLSNLPSDSMRSVEGLWRAHRLRNDLVHTSGFPLSAEEARRALDAYQAFLTEIEAI